MTRPWLSLLLSCLCQLIAFGPGLVVRGLGAPPLAFIGAHALTGFAAAAYFGLARPWRAFNLALPFAAALALELALPAALLPAVLVLLALIYLPTFWTGVPFYPTSRRMYDAVAAKLPARGPFRFLDLGCGYGSLLLHLARIRPAGSYEGVEISPLPYLAARLRASLWGRGQVRIRPRNLWHQPLDGFDFVYAFLAPPPMPRLWAKVRAEMKPGGVFLVNSFPVDAKAESVEEVSDPRRCKLYLYRMK